MELRGRFRRYLDEHVRKPLLRLLRGGVTTKRLAWSLAFGMVLGINPSVGVTTVLVLLLAWVLGLNKLASLIGVHVVAPLHVLLFVPFIELGVYVFHTRHLPVTRRQLEHLSHHPIAFVRLLWHWEWHALVIWAVVAALLLPLSAWWLRRALVALLRRQSVRQRRAAAAAAAEAARTAQ